MKVEYVPDKKRRSVTYHTREEKKHKGDVSDLYLRNPAPTQHMLRWYEVDLEDRDGRRYTEATGTGFNPEYMQSLQSADGFDEKIDTIYFVQPPAAGRAGKKTIGYNDGGRKIQREETVCYSDEYRDWTEPMVGTRVWVKHPLSTQPHPALVTHSTADAPRHNKSRKTGVVVLRALD